MYESVAGQFTAETTLHDVIGRIRRSLNNYLEQYPDIASIGVAVPGPFNQRTSEIILTTSMATADWTNTNLRLQFGEFPVPIAFSHDADAGALADWWFGSRVSELGTSLVHFLVGDGVGAGHVVDGELASQAVSPVRWDISASMSTAGLPVWKPRLSGAVLLNLCVYEDGGG